MNTRKNNTRLRKTNEILREDEDVLREHEAAIWAIEAYRHLLRMGKRLKTEGEAQIAEQLARWEHAQYRQQEATPRWVKEWQTFDEQAEPPSFVHGQDRRVFHFENEAYKEIEVLLELCSEGLSCAWRSSQKPVGGWWLVIYREQDSAPVFCGGISKASAPVIGEWWRCVWDPKRLGFDPHDEPFRYLTFPL